LKSRGLDRIICLKIWLLLFGDTVILDPSQGGDKPGEKKSVHSVGFGKIKEMLF
jgi:hypothetical protein